MEPDTRVTSLAESAESSTIDSVDAALHLILSPNTGRHHIVKNRATNYVGWRYHRMHT